METVCLNGVLEESIAAFYAALTSRGIQPQIHMSGKRIEKQLNRDALSRVFSNILNNALKYSDGDLEITLRDDGEIVFANTASGLNEIQVGKLFDRFFTVEAARNLGGLGWPFPRRWWNRWAEISLQNSLIMFYPSKSSSNRTASRQC